MRERNKNAHNEKQKRKQDVKQKNENNGKLLKRPKEKKHKDNVKLPNAKLLNLKQKNVKDAKLLNKHEERNKSAHNEKQKRMQDMKQKKRQNAKQKKRQNVKRKNSRNPNLILHFWMMNQHYFQIQQVAWIFFQVHPRKQETKIFLEVHRIKMISFPPCLLQRKHQLLLKPVNWTSLVQQKEMICFLDQVLRRNQHQKT